MKKRKLFIILLCIVALFVTSSNTVNAKASKKAMKFLKGTWVSVGGSNATKVIFTRKYMKSYSLWNDDFTVKNPKAKGKYIGKRRIVSTKKKGKKWIIKVGKKGSYTYYKGRGRYLDCWFKYKNEWTYSGTSSLMRVK